MTSRFRFATIVLAVLPILTVGACGDSHPEIAGTWQHVDEELFLTFDGAGGLMARPGAYDTVEAATYQWLADGRLFVEIPRPPAAVEQVPLTVSIEGDTLVLGGAGEKLRFVRVARPGA